MLVNDVVFKEGLTAVLHKEERGGEGGGDEWGGEGGE